MFFSKKKNSQKFRNWPRRAAQGGSDATVAPPPPAPEVIWVPPGVLPATLLERDPTCHPAPDPMALRLSPCSWPGSSTGSWRTHLLLPGVPAPRSLVSLPHPFSSPWPAPLSLLSLTPCHSSGLCPEPAPSSYTVLNSGWSWSLPELPW